MKAHIIKLSLLPAVIAALNLIPAGRVTAQTFSTLHSFAGYPSDGAYPGELISSGNTLYGTTAGNGGTVGYGTVFAVNTDGTGFTNLHRFTPLSAPFQLGGTNSDGANPFGGLILSGNTLYGTATYGGSSGRGTVFSLSLSLSPPEQVNSLIALVPS